MVTEERYKKLKASAQRYTAYRERSPKEVRDKLAEWGASTTTISRILDELIVDKFVDEFRFAKAFCHDKFLINKWGKIRLSMELGKFGIGEDARKHGLDHLNAETYHDTIQQLAEAKWEKLNEPDLFKKRQKTTRYLLQKGFEGDLVWVVVNSMETD